LDLDFEDNWSLIMLCPQKTLDKERCDNVARVAPNNVIFLHLETTFCCGVYGVVNSLLIPNFKQ
jgi:hypothetical protein